MFFRVHTDKWKDTFLSCCILVCFCKSSFSFSPLYSRVTLMLYFEYCLRLFCKYAISYNMNILQQEYCFLFVSTHTCYLVALSFSNFKYKCWLVIFPLSLGQCWNDEEQQEEEARCKKYFINLERLLYLKIWNKIYIRDITGKYET